VEGKRKNLEVFLLPLGVKGKNTNGSKKGKKGGKKKGKKKKRVEDPHTRHLVRCDPYMFTSTGRGRGKEKEKKGSSN